LANSTPRRALGDLAEAVAQQLTTEVSAPVQEAQALTEEAALIAENSLFSKIQFTWQPEDRAIVERIRISAEAMIEEGFTDLTDTIDNFYYTLRIPEQRDGVVVHDADNRVVWEKDEAGKIKEDWSQLTGQDVEYTLTSLRRLHMIIAPQVNQLMLEAVYARTVAADSADESWASVMTGTQGDKQAKANRESRVPRYHAFFRFYLYITAKTLLDEVSGFIKHLENVRYWQVRTQK
jgi:hypothetical protein